MTEESASRPASDGGREGREALWTAVRSVLRSQRAGSPLVPVARDAPLPASFAQQRLWFLERLAPGSSTYNQTVAYRMIGPLSIRSLERGLSEILRRHEALRTTLELVDGQVVQRIHPPPVFAMPVVDLRRLDAAQREDEARQRAAADAREPFDFERAPLMRATLLRMTEREHLLVLTMHHLAFDGWSFEVFMRELCALYGAFNLDKPSPLPELPLQYADYAAWQRKRLRGESLAPLMAYWTRQMGGALPVLSLPADRPRNLATSRRGAFLSLSFPKDLTEALKRLGTSEGATPFMTLLAAFQTLLYRYTGEEDVIVGSPIANRNRAEIEGLVGLFVNTLALRTRLGGQPSFRELLARVRGMVTDAYAHQELPFEMLVEALELRRRTNHSPIFQVMFGYQNVPRSAWALPGLSVDTWNVENGTAKFDVTLFMWETEQGLRGLLEYDTDLFDAATMSQLLGHFRTLLEGIVRNPDEIITAVPLLSAAESRQLTHEWNDTAIDYPRAMTINRVFEGQARQTPEAVALAFEHGELTYAELDRRANQLARFLHRSGVGPGALVGVWLESSPALIVTLLAILKAGAAYVPVDPYAPAERSVGVLRRAAITALVTQEAFASRACGLNVRVVRLDADREEIGHENHENHGDPGVEVAADGLAYVMFTSGSTGTPKGVCITHRGVVRLVKGANYAELTSREVFLQLASIAFDASTFEIWGALLNGAKLALPSASQPTLEQIGQAIRRHRVSILWLTAGLFELWVDSDFGDLGTVRQLLVGGDVVSVPHAERFMRRASGCRLINCYGPTENTTFTSFHPVESGTGVRAGTIPIGRPVSNTQIYVLDPLQQPVPMGVAGEAYIGGDGLMRGYLDDAAATRERLIANPFRDRPGAFLYRTGDVVRHRRDGSLEFLGRTDDQLKIRGFRVEPGEVEAVLRHCPLVKRVAVLAGDCATGGKSLVAYVVPESAQTAPGELVPTLRGFLRERLPEYLVPSDFVLLETIPLTRNGKLDRNALPPPNGEARTRADAFVAPRDERERVVAQSFEQVLGFRPIGLDDDFFEFGGSSLLALRLVAMLEGTFGTSLPLASFYERATVAHLATLLRTQEKATPRPAESCEGLGSTLVEIKRGQSETPFFLVPGGHGGMIEMTLYAKLMSHLKREQSVYGLLARGLDGENEPHASVAEMAQAYVGEVRRLQPRGPYALGGECVGGLVAFEMAQQLLAQEQEVALLLLMDTWCPTFAGVLHYTYFEKPLAILKDRAPIARAGLSDLRRVLLDHIRDRPPFKPVRWLRYGIDVALTLKRVADPWLSEIEKIGKAPAGAVRVFAAETNYVKQGMRYRPRIYPGRVTLLCSAGNYRRGLAKNWRRLAGGGLTVHLAPGDHESYIRDTPEATAELLRTCFDETAARIRHARVPAYLSSLE
jgi:amino acid adenylation domain-containing protein